MRVLKKILSLVVPILLGGCILFGCGNEKAYATNHGYCSDGRYGYQYFINYDETDMLEAHGGKDIIYKWIAKSELIIKFRNGKEYGRYPVYIKKVGTKFYYSENDQKHWLDMEDIVSGYQPIFCEKVEEYLLNEEDKKEYLKK